MGGGGGITSETMNWDGPDFDTMIKMDLGPNSTPKAIS